MNQSIPAPDHRCWLRLALGEAAGFQTRQLGLQLLFQRLRGEPIGPAAKAREVHAFFSKYDRILGPEIAQLSKL